jgi:hypothetical protein
LPPQLPGQWGDGHINCQPKQFWIDLMQGHGWSFNEQATGSFTAAVQSNNVIVESIAPDSKQFCHFSPEATAYWLNQACVISGLEEGAD